MGTHDMEPLKLYCCTRLLRAMALGEMQLTPDGHCVVVGTVITIGFCPYCGSDIKPRADKRSDS